ncbi:hypothetical protein F5Y15DRAFT_158593 [Xylariaceae sp. FL0016]|nr:hypothetical protein F5Y15DRAFT_158593 [Xylariaceae sp. FL0016]
MSSLDLPPPENPNDPGRKNIILGVSWTLTAISCVFIVIRFLYRRRVPSRLGWDDWSIGVAGCLQLVHVSFVTTACHYGAGMHDEDLTLDQLVHVLKWFWITTTPAILVSIVARASAAILLIRIFGSKTWLRWYFIIFTVFQIIGGIINIVFIWIQQTPIESVWNPLVEPTFERAGDFDDISAYVSQALFAFADLSYVLFPVVIIWKLNMPLRNKIGLCVVMGLSLISFVGSVMKAVTSSTAESQYSASLVILWSSIEQTLVIIISCIPALRHAILAELPMLHSIGSSLVRIVTGARSRKGSATSVGTPSEGSPSRSKYRNLPSRGKGSVEDGGFGSQDAITSVESHGPSSLPGPYGVELGDYPKPTETSKV